MFSINKITLVDLYIAYICQKWKYAIWTRNLLQVASNVKIQQSKNDSSCITFVFFFSVHVLDLRFLRWYLRIMC